MDAKWLGPTVFFWGRSEAKPAAACTTAAYWYMGESPKILKKKY
jgi:hypothetical protein